MLRSCLREEFDQYGDFAYELAEDLTKSGYPTYCDGIKTKDMFVERSLKAFERDTEEMLIFEQEGEVRGLIHYYWLPEDQYLAAISFNISQDTETALSDFFSYIRERFKGYDVFLGFPSENTAAVRFLAGQGFECIEDDYNNTAYLDKIEELPEYRDMIRIDRENYEDFRFLHSQIEGDMYWNTERILKDLDHWTIFVKKKDGRPQGAVYYTDADDGWFEIFGIDIDQDAFDPVLFKELLQTALLDVKKRNGRFMTFFCEKEYEEATLACGFICVGNYLCYKTHIE